MPKNDVIKTAKVLTAKKDPKDGRKNLKIEHQEGEKKKDFIARYGKQICGDDFQLPIVY